MNNRYQTSASFLNYVNSHSGDYVYVQDMPPDAAQINVVVRHSVPKVIEKKYLFDNSKFLFRNLL